jgi:hypothetical protein
LPPKNKKNPKKNMDFTYGGIKMKKLIVLALIAMLFISMLAFSACKAKVDENATDTTMVEEVVDTLNAVADTAAVPATPAP